MDTEKFAFKIDVESTQVILKKGTQTIVATSQKGTPTRFEFISSLLRNQNGGFQSRRVTLVLRGIEVGVILLSAFKTKQDVGGVQVICDTSMIEDPNTSVLSTSTISDSALKKSDSIISSREQVDQAV